MLALPFVEEWWRKKIDHCGALLSVWSNRVKKPNWSLYLNCNLAEYQKHPSNQYIHGIRFELKWLELILTGCCRCHCGLKYFQHRPLKALRVRFCKTSSTLSSVCINLSFVCSFLRFLMIWPFSGFFSVSSLSCLVFSETTVIHFLMAWSLVM